MTDDASPDPDFELIAEQIAPFKVGNRTDSTALLAWFIENVMREDPDATETAICDGGGDKGIDGILYDEDGGDLFVIQAKHRTNEARTQGDGDLKAFMGSAHYFAGPEGIDALLDSSPNQEVVDLIDRLDLKRVLAEDDPTVRFVFVTNAERDSSAVDYLATVAGQAPALDLWDRSRLAEIAARTRRPGLLADSVTLKPSSDVIQATLSTDSKMVLALVPAAELVRLPGIENLTVFDVNVRLGLGNTKINRQLRATMRDNEEHGAFPAYHNGLTLLTDGLEVDDDGIHLDGVGVVNGCQSLQSLWRERSHITPALSIMVKVVQTGTTGDLADRITYRSNNQNPVNIRDQRSNDRIQRDLQTEVREKYGTEIFYGIRRGQPEDPKLHTLDNQLAAQLLMAIWLKEPWNAVRKVRLFDQDYHRIFRTASADKLYLAYLIDKAIEGKKGSLVPSLQTSFASVRFTLAHLVGEILRQNDLGSELLDNPGRWIPTKTSEVAEQLAYYAAFAVEEINYYVKDREEAREKDPTDSFDPKTAFKSSTGVRPLERQTVQAVKAQARRQDSDVLFDIDPT